MLDLFGYSIKPNEAIHVSIYADEIWPVKNIYSNENWIYSMAIYERTDMPILNDLINYRFLKERENWKDYIEKNNTNIHWAEIGEDLNKKFVIERWLEYIRKDCFGNRKFYFSLIGINLNNFNTSEFDKNQNLNSIYNRFFRSMLKYSLKKFFGRGVIVENIFHEQGSQEKHKYFDWHTIFKLDQDEHLNFNCNLVEFLPKSHKEDKRVNILQLCDVLGGIFKDLHCGFTESKKNTTKRQILDLPIVNNFFIKRVLRESKNVKSSYGHAKRFHVSFFPKIKSELGSLERLMDNFYDTSKIELGFEYNPKQAKLF